MPNKREISFSPELANRLAELITAEDDVKIVETLRLALDAELTMRAPRERGDPNNYLVMPDWRVRVMAAKIMGEMKYGRPRQSVDVKVSNIDKPMSRIEAAKVLLQDWDEVKRIGDEHVRLLKQALPVAPDGNPAQNAEAELVDVELGAAQ